MNEEIKANNAILRTGIIIMVVNWGIAIIGVCYLLAIM